ncbi:hypothetical protein MRB53_012807 [Persea americana]|uniref:Uncharacterized protein n=1 Tax=Persea americana TaxID=3435 RepID=A0ACC2LYQ2_PERAE|nr:hypothetical protein MRB53_012807 [Persea americana]
MGRAPCCDKANVKRGPWSPEEDTTLRNYVGKHGTGGNWIALPHKAGLKRCGKSCRLRWLNYLRPDIKHGGFTEEEDNIICTLYQNIGSRWSVIASHLPGRTDNDVKNYWNTKLKKKHSAAISNFTANTNHIQLSTSTSPVSVIKSENHGNCFLNSVSGSSTSLSSTGVGFESKMDSLRLYSDPIQFPLPGLKETPEFGVISNSYDVSSSSSFPTDNSCISWSGNANGEVDGFFMDVGYGSAYDHLHGYGSQEKMLEVAPSFANFSFSSLLASTESKPQGVYQSMTY